MDYNIKIIRKDDYKTSLWSGGTTTELLIFPPEAVYGDRNFKWRLSSATVNIETSTFTSLPGISRIIIVLEGNLLLEHEGHHKVSLKAFEQDSFSGDWVTKSHGKVTDFNLMIAEGCKGELEPLFIEAGENLKLIIRNEGLKREYMYKADVFYCVSGEIEILTRENKRLRLFQGDLIYISGEISEDDISLVFLNKTNKQSKLIRTKIHY